MGVDAGISSSTRQVLVLTVGDMEVRLWVTVLLGETEIDDIDLITALADAHQEIVGFDVSMDERFRVNILDPRDELVGQE